MLLEILHDVPFCVVSMQTKITIKKIFWGMTFIKYDLLGLSFSL